MHSKYVTYNMIPQILMIWCELLKTSCINSDDLSVCIDSVRYVSDYRSCDALVIFLLQAATVNTQTQQKVNG